MSIQQHEIELKELLTRVMRDPLLPLQVQLDQTGKNVAHLDQQLSTLREVEIGGMCARLDAVETILKRLRNWAIEDAANELKSAILPPVHEALDTLTLRLDSHAATIAQPVQSICQDVAQIATVVEQLAEHSAQARALAVQRDASLGEQVNELSIQQVEHWRLTQVHVREAADAAIERLSAMSASASATHQSNLQRLVEVEVSKRIDKLIMLGRWTVSLAVAAVCAASGCLALLARSLY
jgi:hypothetical protein